MIGKLTLYYNRTRQAVITRELIEIISGAAALDSKEQIDRQRERAFSPVGLKSIRLNHQLFFFFFFWIRAIDLKNKNYYLHINNKVKFNYSLHIEKKTNHLLLFFNFIFRLIINILLLLLYTWLLLKINKKIYYNTFNIWMFYFVLNHFSS